MTSFFTGSPIRLRIRIPGHCRNCGGDGKKIPSPGSAIVHRHNIINHLGKYSAEIDGVGRSQIELLRWIGKCLLDKVLAVIKLPADGDA